MSVVEYSYTVAVEMLQMAWFELETMAKLKSTAEQHNHIAVVYRDWLGHSLESD